MRMRTVMKSLAAAAIATLTFGAMADNPAEEGVQLWEDGPYWATCNVGASDPMEEGYFYWWGDTNGYVFVNNQWDSVDGTIKDFDFSANNKSILTIGMDKDALFKAGYINADGTLKPEYDPATRLLGEPWRMPTQAEIDKLVEKCDYIKVGPSATYQRFSYKFQGKGDFVGKSILFCGSGSAVGKTHTITTTTAATIWSSSPSIISGDDASWYLSMPAQGSASSQGYNRYTGYAIRAVRTKPLATKNAITIDTEIQHGSVTADKEKAAKDDTVTLTVTPDAGYATSELKYFKTEDPSEEVEISGDSFTMPDYAVTVTATFEAQDQTITLAPFEHGSVETDPAGSARTDATVTINPSPELGYAVGALKVTKSDDPSTEVPVSDNQFTMPPYGVTVAVTFVAQSQTISIAGTEHGMVETSPAGSAKTDETVTITTTPESGYALKTISVAGTMTEPEVTPVEEGKTYTFVMPYEEVTVTATFEELTAKVVPVKADNTSVEGVYTNGVKVAESTTEKDTYIVKKGADVTVKFQGYPGYFFKEGDNYLPTKDVVAENVQADIEVPCPEGPVQGTSAGGTTYYFMDGGAMTMVGSGAATSLPAGFNRDSVTSVKIGDGITSIGAGFFLYCPYITTVTGGKDLAAENGLGSQAFHLCMSLATATFDCTSDPGIKGAIKYNTYTSSGGQLVTVPTVSYQGSVEVLYGKDKLEDAEWTRIGVLSKQPSMYEIAGFHFFQVRVEKEVK